MTSRHVDIAGAFLFGVLLVLVLAMGGCALDESGLDPATSQDAPGSTIAPPPALALVLGFYGAPERWPGPPVRLVAGQPECKMVAYLGSDGRCKGGEFNPDRPDEIVIAVWPGSVWAQTSLAHETLHWLLFHEGRDYSHTDDFYAQVERANELLWRSGL